MQLLLWAACVRAQRMDVFSSPYGIRLDESAPPDKCLEVGWCRDALAYLPPSSFVRWCGWARTRCLSVRAASDDPRIPIELNVMTVDQYSWWAGRSHNYTQKNSVGIRDVACRGTLCHKPYGPYPGLLSNETYCVIISRAPNATYNGSRAGDPGLVTVRYRARTDCGGAAAMRLTAWLMLGCLLLALLAAK